MILVGLPASGKTTFYHERLSGTHAHVSKDLQPRQRRSDRRQAQIIAENLSSGRSVVIDNTNASVETRAGLISLAKAYGAIVTGYYFPTDPTDALRRNRARQGLERVPDVAIFAIRSRLEPPVPEEGFDRLFIVSIDEEKRTFDVEPFSQ